MDAEAVVGEQACAVDFLIEAETAMIAGVTCGKRTALQSQTQRAAMDDAVRCDERRTALRHFTRAIPMRQEGPNNRTLQPPIGLQRPRLSYPSMPSESCLLPQKDTCCAGFSGPPDRLPKGIQGTQKQDGASQEAERRKMCDRTERPKRLNVGNRTTRRGEPRGRTMKDMRQDGAGQRKERKTTDMGRKHEWQALLRLPLEYHTMQVRS